MSAGYRERVLSLFPNLKALDGERVDCPEARFLHQPPTVDAVGTRNFVHMHCQCIMCVNQTGVSKMAKSSNGSKVSSDKELTKKAFCQGMVVEGPVMVLDRLASSVLIVATPQKALRSPKWPRMLPWSKT